MAYYVSYSDITPSEPSSGWYYTRDDGDGSETICGPFYSKAEALDDESDGAYSAWLDAKHEERYERDLIESGRGHLLRKDV